MAHESPIRRSPAAQGPGIPDKLYFRIGEVARLCEVPAYVLRFWESEFPQLRPNKGGTGQRLFRRRDVEVALRIKCLLYDEGYTIPGARQLLKGEAKAKEPQLSLISEAPPLDQADRSERLRRLRSELGELLALLSRPEPETPRRHRPVHGAERRSEKLFDFNPATPEAERNRDE